MRCTTALAATAVIFLGAGATTAQNEPGTLFGPLPEVPVRDDAATPPATRRAGRQAARIDRLSAFPEPAGWEAARRLVLEGDEAVPELLAALADPDWRVRAGCVWALGELGAASAFGPIAAGAEAMENRIAVGYWFEAMVKLDPVRATAELLPRLRSSAGRVAKEAFLHLPRRLDDRHRATVLAFVTATEDDLRLRALDLAARLETPIEDAVWFPLLGDSEPRVARRVAEMLARSDDPATRQRLVRELTDVGLRTSSYAAIALVLAEDALGAPAIPETDAHVERLRKMLLVRGDLENAAAAIALANLSMRSDREDVRELANTRVPFILVRTAAGGRLFRDFGSVRDLAVAKLEAISGRDFGDDADAWKRWWLAEGPSFQARRDLRGLDAESALRARIGASWIEGGEVRSWTFATATPGAGGAEDLVSRPIYLTPESMAEIAAAVSAAGAFDARGDAAVGGDEPAAFVLEIALGGASFRRRHERAVPDELTPLLDLLQRTAAREAWQTFHDPARDGDFTSWLTCTRAELARLEGSARATAIADLAASSYRALGSRGRTLAIEAFERAGAAWGAARRDDLVAGMRQAGLEPAAARPLVLWLAGIDGATPGVLDALPLYSEAGLALAADHLALRPIEDSLELASASDVERRRAGLHGLARRCDRAEARAAMIALLGDADPGVANAAADLVAAAPPEVRPAFFDALEEVTRDGEGAARERSLRLLGRLGGPRAAARLLALLLAAEGPARSAAVAALGTLGGGEAQAALIELCRGAEDGDARAEAARALAASGAGSATAIARLLGETADPRLRAELIDLTGPCLGSEAATVLVPMLEDRDARVRTAAAWALAEARVPAAVPTLIALLDDEACSRRARAALERLTFHVSRALLPDEAQRDYQAWWEQAAKEVPTDLWLLDELDRQGFRALDLAPWLRGEREDVRVAGLMVAVLSSPRPELRLRANEILTELRGASFGPVGAEVAEQDLETTRSRWSSWLRDRLQERR